MRARTSALVLLGTLVMAGCQGGQGPLSLELWCLSDHGTPSDLPVDVIGPGDAEDLGDWGPRPDLWPDALPDLGADIEDVPPTPGGLDYPCESNGDCLSNACIEGVDGFVCTITCETECPEGWYCRAYQVGPDVRSLCTPAGANLCKPCKNDLQCGDGVCMELPEGRFCGRDCTGGKCPDGYQCVDMTREDGQPSRQCRPANGTCSCRVSSEGQERTCVRENEVGTCFGYETCNVALGWVGCTAREPMTEVCNGVDDDCNGVADDNPARPGETCQNEVPGVGACSGTPVCRGEAGWVCVGPTPAPETCNYVDDDCDGLTDEDFVDGEGRYVSLENCGVCGVSCEGRIPFATEVSCSVQGGTPTCEVERCQDGYIKVAPSVCSPAISNLCLPCTEDANCGFGTDRCVQMGDRSFCGRDCSPTAPMGTECPDGYECESFGGDIQQCIPVSRTCDCTLANTGALRVCQVRNSFGACSGTETCDPAVGWVNCTARTPAPEVCNGLDDDCNGLTDDGVVAPSQPCQKSWTDPGSGRTYTCSAPWVCEATPSGVRWNCKAATPAPETCNGLDDNCDGQTDEDFKVPGTDKYGMLGHCGGCGISCEGLVPHGTMTCNTVPERPVCEVASCDPGYWKSSPLSCSPLPDTQCLPCSSDAACQVPGDVCLALQPRGDSHCLWDCSPSSLHPVQDPVRGPCPQGYRCAATDAGGNPFYKCVPESGDCSCLERNRGESRLCEASNAFGRCVGVETCDPARGWGGCTARVPAAEACNGVDDDCNGLTDENWPALGGVCSVGQGACAANGTWQCDESLTGVVCNAVPRLPTPERCNSIDDDCNGRTDEAWVDLGKPCFLGQGECRSAGVYVCTSDGLGLRCDAEEILPAEERCNDRDDNCDGQIDENWPTKGQFCSVGQGVCQRNGVLACRGDGTGLECNVSPGTPGTESCNGLDDDCDGQVDEDWPTKGQACTVGQGVCLRLGTNVCRGDGSGVQCDAVPGTPGTERCNGLDDNCDGQVDEDWPTKGQACTVGQGVCLRIGTNVCRGDGTGVQCDAVPGTAGTERCNGLDDDCDGQVDEDWPTKGQVCSVGQGVCRRDGVLACLGDGSGIQCNAVPGTAGTESCNGLDDDCDGSVDEDWPTKGQACSAGQGVCRRDGVLACRTDGTGILCDAVPGTPGTESCNGLDDDCDGLTDEDWPLKGTVCTAGQGVCLRTGTWECRGDGVGIQCNATPGIPQTETCNYLDDNCDGVTDDGFVSGGKYWRDTACGNCFTDCTVIYGLPNAYGTCDVAPTVPECRLNCQNGYFNLNGIPDDGCEFGLDTGAVYVSVNDPAAVDNAGCGLGPVGTGTGNYPCKSIGQGQARAATLGRSRILVADGLYLETVTIQNGRSLLGGYRSDTWERHVSSTLTLIRGTVASPHAKTLIGNGINSSTLVEGFLIEGFTPVTAGANSYAVWLKDCTSALELRNNVIQAGNGAPGLPGTDGASGQAGVAGAKGQDAANVNAASCWGNPSSGYTGRTGGAAGIKVCQNPDGSGTTNVSGGAGGFTSCPARNRQEGSTTPNPSPGGGASGIGPTGGGSGGPGGWGHDGTTSGCTPTSNQLEVGTNGGAGAQGTDGTGGTGASGPDGGMAGDEWAGNAGGNGTHGVHGSGGGGGGGGGGNNLSSTSNDDFGGGGGGGGSGGCAGARGTGGTGGGGSFAIFLTFSGAGPSSLAQVPVITGNSLRRGLGGSGGRGGNGGPGGDGGAGGPESGIASRNGPIFCVFGGAKGGSGGRGGHAGGGGGGAGGVSFDIFANNINALSPNWASQNTFVLGNGVNTGGSGGSGGLSSNTSGGLGVAGVAGSYGNQKLVP